VLGLLLLQGAALLGDLLLQCLSFCYTLSARAGLTTARTISSTTSNFTAQVIRSTLRE
jgi:hypothetical protein